MITPEENIKTILADWLDALRRCDALIYILRFLRFLRNDLILLVYSRRSLEKCPGTNLRVLMDTVSALFGLPDE